jgi:hypothetical protein
VQKIGVNHDRRSNRISYSIYNYTPPTWNVLMFTRKHYEYLADTILRDTDITEQTRVAIFYSLEVWLKRDFDNFNQKKWNKKWKDRFH